MIIIITIILVLFCKIILLLTVTHTVQLKVQCTNMKIEYDIIYVYDVDVDVESIEEEWRCFDKTNENFSNLFLIPSLNPYSLKFELKNFNQFLIKNK